MESGEDLTSNNKTFCLTANYNGAVAWNTIERSQRNMIAEPINVCQDGKSHTIKAQYYKNGLANFITNGGHVATAVAEHVRVGALPRLSSSDGDETDLYAIPIEQPESYLSEKMVGYAYKEGTKSFKQRVKIFEDKACPLTTEQNKRAGTTNYIPQNIETIDCEITTDGTVKNAKPIYEVKDGLITIKGTKYPIKLKDGYYIIRKLTVTECCRLQTLPDDYCRAVSNAQAYRGLGNGWTAEVIIHILNGALKNVPRDEEIVVLSMYDGIGTGRYCLDKMGFTNIKYYAYEIDKYAKQVAMSNYPDIIQMGDAFQLRNNDWELNI